ncbi:MAG: MmcQ/YjbR family DNA-binding protein [Myxococcota bacterium]
MSPTVDDEAVLARLRELIEAWPETFEKLSHGSPTWWGGKKTFAMFHNGSYDDGAPSVWFLAPEGAQEALIASNSDLFYRPKYLGPRGWVGMRLRADTDWNEVRGHLLRGYRMVAPKRALAALDGAS